MLIKRDLVNIGLEPSALVSKLLTEHTRFKEKFGQN